MIGRNATHKTRRPLAGLFLLLLLLATLLPGSATAQAPGISLVSQALYDGTVKYGEWLPVRVRLENSSTDVTGRVQVAVTSAGQRRVIYAQEVELARGARKEVTLYVLPNTFTRRLVVEFISDQAGPDDEPL
ncbi:MAG TPA: hypothetical protein VER55_02935, partial [Ardenticatenaceae bacterium]|nr:hypothetical protein [Ardenticatenaceae bacterium]